MVVALKFSLAKEMAFMEWSFTIVNSRVNPTVFELQYKKPRLDRGFSFLTLC